MFALFHFSTVFALALPTSALVLKNSETQRCVDVQGADTHNGTPLVAWDCNGSDNQLFALVPIDTSDGTQWYNIVHARERKCVDVSKTSTLPGAELQLWDCAGVAQLNQHWEVVDVLGDGQYRLRARHSNLMFALADDNPDNGGRLQQSSDGVQGAQRWQVLDGAMSPPNDTDFVHIIPTSSGPTLALGDKVFYMKGFQTWFQNSICGNSRDRLLQTLDESVKAGANTVRLWFLRGSGGPGNWGTFDDVMAQVKARHMRAIVTLVNQWGDCETQVNGHYNYLSINWYQNGYKNAGDGYPIAYRDYAAAVAEHFKDEPAIAMYQLVNEAEARDRPTDTCPDDNASARAIRAFADDMVDVIRAIDKNHLINLGTQENGFCGVQKESFGFVHAGKIDVCEVHGYEPANDTMPALVSDKVQRCRALNKPIFMGEMGICQNVQPDASCKGPITAQTLQTRADFFAQKALANRVAGLCGLMLWDFQYFAGDRFGINPGEPLISQMPQW